jgi:putative ABC transport system permease protein
MFDFDKWQEIFTSLGRHKLRTFLTAFGVFWGIFMLTLLLGVGQGLENGVYEQFSRSATNRTNIWSRRTRLPYKGLNAGRRIRLTNNDVAAILTHIPEAQHVNANLWVWGEFALKYKTNSSAFSVQGVLPEYIRAYYRDIIQGRFLNAQDIERRRKVVVIGKRVKNVLFGTQEPIGEYIDIKGVLFRVIGVFDVVGFGEDEQATEQVYIPLSTLQRTFQRGEQVGSLNIIVDPAIPVPVVQEKVLDLLKRRHSVHPDDTRAIGTWDSGENFRKLQGLFVGIRIFLWIVGTGTLIAGIVGVSNIMLIIVKERTREIGIRKALGATPWSIVNLILQEAMFLTAISGYLGLIASVILLEGVTYAMERFGVRNEFFSRPAVEMPMAIAAIIILIIAGMLAGFIPARSAAKINPIEALRSE